MKDTGSTWSKYRHVCVLQAANPFFKLLTMLMEFAGGPPGMPPFASYILQRIWEVSLAHVFRIYLPKGFTFLDHQYHLKY
jgi:hypothetical protein